MTALCAMMCAVIVTDRAAAQSERYTVIRTGKAITISGDEIDNALIVVVGGRIEAVGRKVEYPTDSRVIDATAWTAMPGMINPRATAGVQMAQKRGNASHRLVRDEFEPPEDETFEELLAAGYTLLGLIPNGANLPGQMLVVSTHAPEAGQGIRDEGLIRLTFMNPAQDKKLLRDVLKAARDAMKKQEATSKPAGAATRPDESQAATQPATQPTTRPADGGKPSKQPAKAAEKPKIKPELEPLISLLKGDKSVVALVEFSRASDVLHFFEVVEDYEFARSFALPSTSYDDMHHVVDHALFGGADALIAMRPLLPHMPLTVNPYNLAREFTEAGCAVAFFPVEAGVRGHEQARERVALLVRAGLSRDAALRGLTLNAAKYLGVDKDYGSLDRNKRADLVLFDGDPLDPLSKVQMTIVGGEVAYDRAKSKRKEAR